MVKRNPGRQEVLHQNSHHTILTLTAMAPCINYGFNSPIHIPISTSTCQHITYALSDDMTGMITQFDNWVWSASFAGVGLYPSSQQVCKLITFPLHFRLTRLQLDYQLHDQGQGPDGYGGSDSYSLE